MGAELALVQRATDRGRSPLNGPLLTSAGTTSGAEQAYVVEVAQVEHLEVDGVGTRVAMRADPVDDFGGRATDTGGPDGRRLPADDVAAPGELGLVRPAHDGVGDARRQEAGC